MALMPCHSLLCKTVLACLGVQLEPDLLLVLIQIHDSLGGLVIHFIG